MRISGIHHVSIATDDLSKHIEIFKRLFNIEAGPIEKNKDSGVAISLLNIGNLKIELISPSDDYSSISKFLQKRGPGIHHICLLVENINEALVELKEMKVKMIDQEPRVGAGGARIAFIHPESTGGILIELEEKALKEPIS